MFRNSAPEYQGSRECTVSGYQEIVRDGSNIWAVKMEKIGNRLTKKNDRRKRNILAKRNDLKIVYEIIIFRTGNRMSILLRYTQFTVTISISLFLT